MSENANPSNPLPGADIVGRGVYLKPYEPYVLKDYLFDRGCDDIFNARDTGETFHFPENYAINDSPPMPKNRLLNQTTIEESWETFDRKSGLDANVAAGLGAFSIDAQSSQLKNIYNKDASYYALRSSFIPLWAVYLPDLTNLPEAALNLDEIPVTNHKITDQSLKYLESDQVPDHIIEKLKEIKDKEFWEEEAFLKTLTEKIGVEQRNQYKSLILQRAGNPKFDHNYRMAYERFFARYGTHFVRRVWVGGRATLAFIISKSSGLTKEKVQAGIKASYTSIASAELKGQLEKEREKLQEHSECQIFGKGGNEIKLASLNSLDEASYSAWVETIKDTPQVIELDVVGIWTLVPDIDKANALQNAYRAETVFRRISAIFSVDEKIHIVRGNTYFHYDIANKTSITPKSIRELFPILEGTVSERFARLDAAMNTEGLTSRTGSSEDRKIYVFKETECVRLSYNSQAEGRQFEIDEGYPKSIADEWPGVPFDRIDAAINCGPDAIYFFSGSWYVRFNIASNKVDAGYPQKISEGWPGVTFDRVDAGLYWAEGKVYFFREDEYIRFDMSLCRMDPGYPKALIGEYVSDWEFFE